MSDARDLLGVRLSSPDKVLWAEQGVTKSELADYYLAVADRILPHIARRPITLVRCPTGAEKKCFYQRHAGSGVLPQLKEVTIPGFDEPYLYIDDEAGLVAVVQMGTLELHPWGVTVERPDRPDRIIFDLDPAEGLGFDSVVAAALDVRDRLDALGLRSFAKTTGGKGLHVVVPILPDAEWREAKTFAKGLAERMSEERPDLYLARISKAEREGRIFIDYLRNDPTSTAVGPYSTRARAGAPVSLPIEWEEVAPGLDPKAFNLRTVPGLIAKKPDPWAEMFDVRQSLGPAAAQLA
ncbi:non-homologous end-joining DNA ligase [Sphingosinicella sp. YJ22]|uniref:non-homologous end-joining DNA ligase n=1 Tax=Sphingosinicella sp. YJ22 TaxID=1104780 RepID=UPI00140B5FE2|nr:non-homologous end-joining DNA ligase [Sphingosinicella sp. YJ22]